MYDYEGPMLWMASLIHDKDVPADSILGVMNAVIDSLRTTPVDRATLDRALVKMRSDLYDTLGGMYGFGRADLLASFALFDGDPGRINQIEDHLRAVTPELILKTAQEYLRPTNRTVLLVEPGAAANPADSTATSRSNDRRGS
jgi:predicted Zn-dependent peptidase